MFYAPKSAEKNLIYRRGELTSYSTNDVCAFTKTLGGDRVLVLSKLRNKEITFTLPTAPANQKWKDVFEGKKRL